MQYEDSTPPALPPPDHPAGGSQPSVLRGLCLYSLGLQGLGCIGVGFRDVKDFSLSAGMVVQLTSKRQDGLWFVIDDLENV